MQTVSSRIWTNVVEFISVYGNHYTTNALVYKKLIYTQQVLVTCIPKKQDMHSLDQNNIQYNFFLNIFTQFNVLVL